MSRWSVGERWSTTLGGMAWTPISNVFLQCYNKLGITHGEAMFVVHLMQFKWDDSAPFPRLATIAKRMGLSTTSVRTFARRLEEKGFIERKKRPGRSNYFKLDGLFAALERELEALPDEAKLNEEGDSEIDIFSSLT